MPMKCLFFYHQQEPHISPHFAVWYMLELYVAHKTLAGVCLAIGLVWVQRRNKNWPAFRVFFLYRAPSKHKTLSRC